MKKIKRNRILAGTLAFLISFSTIGNANSVLAAETDAETSVAVETSSEELKETEIPMLDEVIGQLAEDEIVTVEELSIETGTEIDLSKDFSGIQYNREKVKLTFEKAETQEGKAFDYQKPGNYYAKYYAEPVSGNPSYQVIRKVIVKEKEPETSAKDSFGSQNSSDDKGSDDEESDSEEEQKVDVIDVGMENGVFLSVVPSSMEKARENVSLVQGKTIWYPSDLGYYFTCYFYVNGKIAYCIESNMDSPPTGDYVAGIYESNLNLQKVLYYGYGGPGDLTGSYLSGYSNDMKYIMTHLAASYCYAGADVAFTGCTQSGLKKYGVMDYINYLCGQEAPPTAALELSSAHENAYLEGDIQRTRNMTLKGDHRNYVTLPLPANVTYHSTTGAKQTGGNVKISGGTTFWFTAPKMSVSGTWNTGKLTGQIGSQWKTLVVSTGNDTQDIGYGDFYEESANNVSFSVTWKEIAKVKVIKEDAKTNVKLAGAVFGLYADKGCTNLIAKMPPTDENGATEIEVEKTQDTIYLKEISVPTGYKLNTKSFNVNLETGKTVTTTVTNEEQKGKIIIRKTGEVLTGITGSEGEIDFTYTDSSYAGAKYKIYAAEDIYSQDKKTKIHKNGELVAELETGEDGSCTSGLLYLGKYRVVEEQAPGNLVIGKTEEERTQYVTLKYAGQTVELSQAEAAYRNERPEIEVNVVKKSLNDGVTLEGAIFGLYSGEDIHAQDGSLLVAKDTLLQSGTSNKDGNVSFTADLPINHKYYIREIQAPDFYYMSSQTYAFTYSYKNDSTYTYTFTHEFENKEVRGEVHIKKIDKDTEDSVSQGNASLDGAVYGLYAAEDIAYPNKKSGIVHRKDELVAKGTIQDGKLDFKDLYLGKYYVKEIAPGEGYLLDETKYPVTVNYEGQNVEIVHRDVTVKETVKKQAFQLIKISEDGEQTETDLVEGAGFKVFLISDLSGVKDGSLKPSGEDYVPEDFIGYDYSEDKTAAYWENGKEIRVPELFTDKKGYVCSPELPYGEYVAFESTTPENLQTVNPFLVTIDEDSREPQTWRVFDDRPIQFYFKIIKKDNQTGKPVLNNSAYYKIFDVEKNEYVEMKVRYPKPETISVFQTNEEGYLQTPEQLKCGTYRIEEIQAPDSFVKVGEEKKLVKNQAEIPLNEVTLGGNYEDAPKDSITITVDSNTAHEVEEGTGKYIVVVEQPNDEAVGSLTLHKRGDILTGAVKKEEQLATKIKNGFAKFVNKVSSFFTGEDVMEVSMGYDFTYESSGLEGVEFELRAAETIYSPDGQKDENGERLVRFEKDGLVANVITDKDGKVTVNNLPIGKYYLKETKAGQNCVLDPEKKKFEIKYHGQETAVDYVTMDLTNQRQKIEMELLKKDAVSEKPLEGVVFALFAEEDILNAAGETIVEKDSLIEMAVSDKEGKVQFQSNLPHGKYYAMEVEEKPGYLPYEEVIHFDASYSNPELEVIKLNREVKNQPTITDFTKTDLTTSEEVEGAKMQILDMEGNLVEEWTSTNEPHRIYALAPGKYILHEEQAPTENGYVRAEDVEFVVELTGEVQKVEMKDDHTKVSISKTDITTGEEIDGAKLQILDKEGNIVEEWVSGEEHLIEYLPVGEYILHEEAAPEGYVIANDVKFVVEETGEIQKVEMQDERAMGQLKIRKTEEGSKKPLEGVEFTLTEKESGKEVAKLVTDKNGEAVSKLLPIAKYEEGKLKEPIVYVLKETKALEGYEKSEETYEIVFEYQDGQTPIIEVLKEITNKAIPDTPETPIEHGPKTGDDTNILLLIGGCLLSGSIAGLAFWRSRKRKSKQAE